MTLLLPLLSPALVYFVLLVVLAVRKDSKGIVTSLIFFAVAVTVGYWSIIQSRSSTAALGFLWLPFLGTIVGFLGLVFGRWARETPPREPHRILGWAALVASVALVGYTSAEGFRTQARNNWRDQERVAYNAELFRNRELIATGLRNNVGRERAYLDSIILARLDDRALLLAALHNDSISPSVLDTVAKSADRGVVLEAIRNPAASAETLKRVYELDRPDYFYQALAGHANTPPDILRNLHANPGIISSLDVWLAGNPAAPRDVLTKIAGNTMDEHVLIRLVQNPSLDCTVARLVRIAFARIGGGRTDAATRAGERQRELCPTTAATADKNAPQLQLFLYPACYRDPHLPPPGNSILGSLITASISFISRGTPDDRCSSPESVKA